MHVIRHMATNVGTIRELLQFMWARKLWWLMPMVVVLAAFGLLIIFGQASGVAPFIYTLF